VRQAGLFTNPPQEPNLLRTLRAEDRHPSKNGELGVKTTITIQDGQVRLSLSPETNVEKLTIRGLGDDISVSRSHEGLVLRPRAKPHNVRKIDDCELDAEPAANATLHSGFATQSRAFLLSDLG
jgi:hypothetical protein